jgi:hypothetical protein
MGVPGLRLDEGFEDAAARIGGDALARVGDGEAQSEVRVAGWVDVRR